MRWVLVAFLMGCGKDEADDSTEGGSTGTEQPAKAEYDAALVLLDDLDRRRQDHQDDEQDRHDDK